MAKVIFGPGGVHSFRGAVGEFVYKRHGNRTILSKKPDMSAVVATEKQTSSRSHFKAAVEFAHSIKKDPNLLAIYQQAARKTDSIPFRAAISDFRKPPEIEEIDLSAYTGAAGGVITVKASDNREVTSVYVRLADSSGETLEDGQAVRDMGLFWKYGATRSIQPDAMVRIEVTAMDLPGNVVVETTYVQTIEAGIQVIPAHADRPASAETGPTIADRDAAENAAGDEVAAKVSGERKPVHVDENQTRPGVQEENNLIQSVSLLRARLEEQERAARSNTNTSHGPREEFQLAIELLGVVERLLNLSSSERLPHSARPEISESPANSEGPQVPDNLYPTNQSPC